MTRYNYDLLFQKIGYVFKNILIIKQALTHRSYHKNNYEKFEFLGDSILNFVITEKLFIENNTLSEGQLSQLRIQIIKGKTLTSLSRSFNLDQYIILGNGEIQSNGKNKNRLLEDIMESIIGAIYIDSQYNINITKQCILNWLNKYIVKLITNNNIKDNKSLLQEFLIKNKYSYPEYKILNIYGKKHKQIFRIELNIQKLDIKIICNGLSKKETEQKIAKIAIENLQKKGFLI